MADGVGVGEWVWLWVLSSSLGCAPDTAAIYREEDIWVPPNGS